MKFIITLSGYKFSTNFLNRPCVFCHFAAACLYFVLVSFFKSFIVLQCIVMPPARQSGAD